MKKLLGFIVIIIFFCSLFFVANADPTITTEQTKVFESNQNKIEDIPRGLDENQLENSEIIEDLEKDDSEKYGYYNLERKIFTELPIFGKKFFDKGAISFPTKRSISIPSSYILGTGDELTINVWGNYEKNYKVEVNHEGDIFLSNIGPLKVQGKTLHEVKQILHNKLTAKYANSDVYFFLSNPKLLYLSIGGEVEKPGNYTLPPLSNILQAVNVALGFTYNGSMRDVQVIRNGNTVHEVDLYPYLLEGIIDSFMLQPNDIVFVPPVKTRVALKGFVERNAVFQLIDNEGIKELIEFAGGFLPQADLTRIQIDRILEPSERLVGYPEKEIISINYNSLDNSSNFKLKDGDVVTVYKISDLVTNYVTIKGSVFKPGKYSIESSPSLKQLINNSGGVFDDAYLDRCDVLRTYSDGKQEIIDLNLEEILYKNDNFALQKLDEVTIYSIWNFKDKFSVSINGSVRKPGTYLYTENMNLGDLLAKSGGVLEDAYLERCDILRTYFDGTTETIDLNLGDSLKMNNLNFALHQLDEVTIYSVWDFIDKFNVTINGAVRKPGKYMYTKDMEVIDLLTQAGGFEYFADSTWIEISRLKLIEEHEDTLWNVFQLDLNNKKNYNYKLKEFDRIFVRKRSEFRIQDIVHIEGEVKYPGAYSLITDEDNLMHLIERAGGVTQRAFTKGIMVLRPLLKRTFTNEEIKNIINNAYEMEYDTTANVIEVVEKSGFVKFKNINFQRVNVDLNSVLDGKEQFIIKNGDIINVPKKTDEVFVIGAVPRSGTYKLKDRKNYRYYIELAGGLNENADKKNISILKYNGLVYTKSLSRIIIENGDYIIIPKELKKPSHFWSNLKDIALVISSVVSSTYIIYQITK